MNELTKEEIFKKASDNYLKSQLNKNNEKGIKFDGAGTSFQKLRYDLVLPETLKALAEVYTHGCAKYGANTWQNVELERYIAAFFRHFQAYRMGELTDNESGLPHLYHALWNMATICALVHDR